MARRHLTLCAALVAASAALAVAPGAVGVPGDPDSAFSADGYWESGYERGAVGLIVDGERRATMLTGEGVNPDDSTRLRRLLSTGEPDPGFAGDGVVDFDSISGAGSYENPRAFAADSIGRLVVLDFVQQSGNKYDLTRYASDGMSSTSWAFQTVGPTFAEDLLMDGVDRFVVAGYSSGFDLSVVRFTAAGPSSGPDPSFADAGVRTLEIGMASGAAVVVRDQGRLVLGGFSRADFTHAGETGRWVLVRLRSDGSLDPNFSGDGKVAFRPLGGYGGVQDVAIDGSRRIVAVGTVRTCPEQTAECAATERPALARFLPDGTRDPAFGVDGFAVMPRWLRSRTGRFDTVALDPRGWIVVGGDAALRAVVARFGPDGQPDGTFATDGVFRVDPYPDAGTVAPHGHVDELAVWSNGTIVAAGYARAVPGYHSAIWRLKGGKAP